MPSSDYFGCTEIFLLSQGSVGQGGVGGGGSFCPRCWGSDKNQWRGREFYSHCRGLLIVGSHGQKGASSTSTVLWFSSPQEYRAGTSSRLRKFLSMLQALRRQVTDVPIICVLRFGHPLYSGDREFFSILTGHYMDWIRHSSHHC